MHRSLCLSLCIWVQVSEETRRGNLTPWSCHDRQSWATWHGIWSFKSWAISQPPTRSFCSIQKGTEGLEDEQLGCRCVTVALCDKQQQTPILGSPFSALSGLDPQLSLPSLSSAQVCLSFIHFPLHSYSLTALPRDIWEAHGRQLCFSNKASG